MVKVAAKITNQLTNGKKSVEYYISQGRTISSAIKNMSFMIGGEVEFVGDADAEDISNLVNIISQDANIDFSKARLVLCPSICSADYNSAPLFPKGNRTSIVQISKDIYDALNYWKNS